MFAQTAPDLPETETMPDWVVAPEEPAEEWVVAPEEPTEEDESLEELLRRCGCGS